MMQTTYPVTSGNLTRSKSYENSKIKQSLRSFAQAGGNFLKKHYFLVLAVIGIVFLVVELHEHILTAYKNRSHFTTEVVLVFLLLSTAYGLIRILLDSLEKLNQAMETLRLKYDLGKALSASQDPGEVATRLVNEVGLIVPQAKAQLYLYEKKRSTFKLSPAGLAQLPGQSEGCTIDWSSLDGSLCSQCMLRQNGMVQRGGFCRQMGGQRPGPGENSLCLPLAQGATPVGLLHLQVTGGSRLDERQVSLLENSAFEMASSLSLAMEKKFNEEVILAQKVHSIQLEIARDLHDTIGQNIGYLRMRLDHLAEKGDRITPASELNQMVAVANESYDLMRGTLAVLQTGGAEDLHPLFRGYTDKVMERTGMEISFIIRGAPSSLPPGSVRQLFYIFREALNNIEKHARASQIWIEMEWNDDSLRLSIADNGIGFDTASIASGHYGLLFMRGRVESLQGSISIQSISGAGTSIHIQIPCQG
jgi:signal transduction histidine kinase